MAALSVVFFALFFVQMVASQQNPNCLQLGSLLHQCGGRKLFDNAKEACSVDEKCKESGCDKCISDEVLSNGFSVEELSWLRGDWKSFEDQCKDKMNEEGGFVNCMAVLFNQIQTPQYRARKMQFDQAMGMAHSKCSQSCNICKACFDEKLLESCPSLPLEMLKECGGRMQRGPN